MPEATVAALARFPVKSMMGEDLNAAEVTARGLLGDRAYALVDAASGKVASAKNPKLWARLFDCRARFVEPPQAGADLPGVRIELPDGRLVASGGPGTEEALGKVLGRPVRLQTEPPPSAALEEYWPDVEGLEHRERVTDEAMAAGTFFDAAPVHLLTTSTLDALRGLQPGSRFEARRFRPNLVVATPGQAGFVEQSWVGRDLRVGGATLRVFKECGRCVMTTLPQGDLPHDPGVLRAAAQHNRVKVGVYAEVVRPGRVLRGDPVGVA